MKKLVEKFKINRKSARRIFALALAFVFIGTLTCEFYNVANNCAFAEEKDKVGKTYYYKWHRCRNNDELFSWLKAGKNSSDPDSKEFYCNRILLLYGGSSDGTPSYRLTGIQTGDKCIYGQEVNSQDCIDGSKDTFTTVSNFNAPFVKYGGEKDGDQCIYVRFMSTSSPSAHDEAYELPLVDSNKQASQDGHEYGQMTQKALDESKILVYSCRLLAGGTQSDQFYPKLTSKVMSDIEEGMGGGVARTAQMQLVWNDECPDGTTLLYITRAHLIDGCCRWKNKDGTKVWMCYQTTDRTSWFKIYVSTLVEKPAIESSILFSGTTSNLIKSTIIKPGVIVTVESQAVLRLEGEITNLGEIVVGNGGTLIVDYDAYVKTDTSAVRKTGTDPKTNTNRTVIPGRITVENGGQLIILDGSVVNLCKNQYTDVFIVAQGGSMYLGGAFFNQSETQIRGDLYISSTGSIHQGYYMSGTPSSYTLTECWDKLIFYNTSTLTMEPRGEETALTTSECACGLGWDPSNKDYFQKYGGIIWGADNSWTNKSTYMYLYPGMHTKTDSIQKNMSTVYSRQFDQDGNRIYITQRVTWTPDCISMFFKGELNGMLNAFYTNPSGWTNAYYGNGKVYANPYDINDTLKQYYTKSIQSDATQDMKDAYTEEANKYYGAKFVYSDGAPNYKVTGDLRVVELDCSGNESSC